MQIETQTKEIGRSHDRADGRLKVTGSAKYSADFAFARMAYAVFVGSSIAKGRLVDIDVTAAEAASGVISVLTSRNAMRVNKPADIFDPTKKQPSNPNEVSTNTASSVLPLQSDEVHCWGQIVAAVIAESFEQAQAAADVIAVTYEAEKPLISLRLHLDRAATPASFLGKPITVIEGDPEGALVRARVKIDETYSTPIENHHAMEMQSTTAEWRGDELFVEETTRFVQGVKRHLAQSFGIAADNVHVRAKFVGGAFGSKGAVRPHVTLAAMCAKQTGRPIKLLLTRRQVTYTSGHRPETLQRFALGAERDGRLTAIIHEGFSSCSATDPFIEAFTTLTAGLYAAPNRALSQKIVYLNASQPTNMRGPGETSGMYAQECAMDELAFRLGIDPIEVRRINEPDKEPITGKTFSCRRLLECIDKGAAAFGWERRNQTPRAVREGHLLIGYGYATATYPMKGSPCQARCRLPRRRANPRAKLDTRLRERHRDRGSANCQRRARREL